MIRVTIWNEYVHEQTREDVRAAYPQGIHGALAEAFGDEEFAVTTVTMDMPDNGLSADLLAQTDVLLYWAHCAHHKMPDEAAVRVQQAVLGGMGVVFLHSAHASKAFKALMGTACSLHWREEGETERLWIVEPEHPIVRGVQAPIDIPHEEMYGEPFRVPTPEQVVLLGSFAGGEAFRAGCCWHRGMGRVFYFQPGHETYPTYYLPKVQQIIRNAARWAARTDTVKQDELYLSAFTPRIPFEP